MICLVRLEKVSTIDYSRGYRHFIGIAMALDLTSTVQRDVQRRLLITRGVSYPFMSLGEALEAARKFYQAERKTAAPVKSAIAHFGYAETSSGGRQMVSALLQFGLLEDEGRSEDRHVRLTPRALTILLSEDDAPERRAALAECIVSPKIYREIFAKWPDDLPSDQTISFFLQREKNFNPKAIESFIKDLRASLAFVGVEHPRELNDPVPDNVIVVSQREHNSLVRDAGSPPFDQGQRGLPTTQHAVDHIRPLSMQVGLGPDEKEWMRGSLGKGSEYRLLITGPIASKQIARLIKLLEAQKAVLEDDDDDDPL